MNQRNIGLDLLRLLAMFFIVLIHVNKFGDLLQNNFFVIDFLPIYSFECLGIVAVNCFVLISGFFLIKQEFRLKKLVSLIAEITFYTILLFIIAVIIKTPMNLKLLIKGLFPITFGVHWFITCYIMLYILFPFINKFIYSLSLKKKHIFAIITILLFCLWTFIPNVNRQSTCEGYSILWLAVLYYWGAYIRLIFIEGDKKDFFNKIIKFSGSGYIICSLITLTLCVSLNLVGKTIWYALDYNKIFVFIASIFLFVFMYKINIKNSVLQKLILLFASASFGVFLISTNVFVLYYQQIYLTKDFFLQSFNMPIMVLICAIGIFVACLLISSLFHKRIFAFSDRYLYPLVEKVYIYIDKKLFGKN